MTTLLAAAFRLNQAKLSSMLVDELRLNWSETVLVNGAVDPTDVGVDIGIDYAVGVVREFRNASRAMAANYYREERALAGAPGRFRPTLADSAPYEQVSRSLRWALGTAQGGRDADAALSLLDGVSRRLVLNGARETILESVRADRYADRYARVAAPNACAFCALTSIRGAVYHSEVRAQGSRGFHNSCRCQIEPVFAGQRWAAPKHVQDWDALYARATADVGETGEHQLVSFRRALRAARQPAA